MLITQSIFKTLALISHVSDLELFSDSVSLYKKNHADIDYAGSYKRMMISVSPSSGKREEISVSIINSIPSFPKQFLILLGILFLSSRYRCFDIMDISHKDTLTA